MKVAFNTMPLFGKSEGIRRYVTALPKALKANDVNVMEVGGKAAPAFVRASLALPKLGFCLRQGFEHIWMPQMQVVRNADILHCADSYAPLRAGVTPVVLTCHDITFYTHPELHETWMRRWMDVVAWRGLYRAPLVIVDSAVTRDDLIRVGIPQGKLRVVHLGVDHVPDGPGPVPFGLEKGQYVCYLGNLEPRKNVQRLIAAFSGCRDRLPAGTRLVLAGKHAWGDPPCGLSELLAEGAVLLPGRVSDADAYALIGNAGVFVYPSLYEGFGLPPLEALKLGTPVIVGETAVSHEILSDVPVYVDPLSVSALAQALRAVMCDRDWEGRGEAGIAHASQYTWDRAARLTAEVYDEAATL